MTHDPVNRPDHYNHIPVECIEVTRHFDFNTGNAIKYLWRAGFKDDAIQDYEKAIWYINDQIKSLTEDKPKNFDDSTISGDIVKKFNVLDHGKVELIGRMGSDYDVVEAARVMPGVEWRGQKDIDLIHYLGKHNHTTPFEHVVFKFHVKAPIFVLRQWHRHRTWSYNEVSARYKEVPEEYYLPEPKNIGSQAKKDHQSRDMEERPDGEKIEHLMVKSCTGSIVNYRELIDKGVPRELARMVLPQNMYSEMIATVNLWNLIKFLKLRMDEHAQWEIRQYACRIAELVYPHVGESLEAFDIL